MTDIIIDSRNQKGEGRRIQSNTKGPIDNQTIIAVTRRGQGYCVALESQGRKKSQIPRQRKSLAKPDLGR